MASVPGDNGQLGGIVPYGGGSPGAGAAGGGLGTLGQPSTVNCPQGFCSMYCPQSCFFSTPPPPFDFSVDGGDSSGPTFSPLVIAIIGILGSAFLLIAYYTIISKYCARIDALHIGGGGRRRRRHHHATTPLADIDDDGGPAAHHLRHLQGPDGWQNAALVSEGLDEAVIKSIAVCKYKKGDGFVDGTDCPVCLTEFHEDEALRLLPKCGHAFHVGCIDTWLKSHSNCPLCRANIAPIPLPMSPPAPVRLPLPPQPQVGCPREMMPAQRVPSNRANFSAVAVEDLLADRGGSGRRDGVLFPGTAAAAASIKDNESTTTTTIRGMPRNPEMRGGDGAVLYEIRDDAGGHSSRRRDHHVVSIGEVLETEDEAAAAGSTSSGRRVMAHHSKYYGTSKVLHCVMNGPVGRLYFGGNNNHNRHNNNSKDGSNNDNSGSSTPPSQ